MSILSKLFGGGGTTKAAQTSEPVTYQGFRITASPMPEGSQFRIAATIEKEIGGELKTHQLIRADMLNDHKDAVEASINKAKVLIDQMGDKLF